MIFHTPRYIECKCESDDFSRKTAFQAPRDYNVNFVWPKRMTWQRWLRTSARRQSCWCRVSTDRRHKNVLLIRRAQICMMMMVISYSCFVLSSSFDKSEYICYGLNSSVCIYVGGFYLKPNRTTLFHCGIYAFVERIADVWHIGRQSHQTYYGSMHTKRDIHIMTLE